MTRTELSPQDVVIIGAGPAGLSLANLLGMRGVSVTLLEMLPQLIDYPRGVGIDDESLRSLQTMGLVQKALPFTTPSHIMRLVNGRGKQITEIRPATDEFGWSRRNAFIQPEVDRVLYEGLDRFPNVRVLFGHEVTALSDEEDAVTVSGTTPTGEFSIRAAYVVGADGGRSHTRKHIGVSFEGQSPSTRWLVADVRDDPIGAPNVYLGGDPRRPYVSIGLPQSIRRFEFLLFDDEPDTLVDDDRFVERLLAPHVPDPRSIHFVRKRVYTHHSRIAGEFRRGRVFLIGDAAHLMPVWQGQGWNSGQRDATNLAWKLAAVITGQCDDRPARHLQRRASRPREGDDRPVDRVREGRQADQPRRGRAAGMSRHPPSTSCRACGTTSPRCATSPCRAMPPAPWSTPRHSSPAVSSGRVGTELHTRPHGARAHIRRRDPLHPARRDDVRRRVEAPRRRDRIPLGGAAMGRRSRAAVRPRISVRCSAGSVRCSSRCDRSCSASTAEPADPDAIVVGDTAGRLKAWFDERSTPVLFLRPDRFVAAATVPASVQVAPLPSLARSSRRCVRQAATRRQSRRRASVPMRIEGVSMSEVQRPRASARPPSGSCTRCTTGTPTAPVRDLLGDDVDAAYDVQEARRCASLESAGNPRVGRKVGLTSVAVQRQLGVDQPDFGVLLADMDATGMAEVPSGRLLQPRIEAELAFVLERDVDDPERCPRGGRPCRGGPRDRRQPSGRLGHHDRRHRRGQRVERPVRSRRRTACDWTTSTRSRSR